MVIEYPDTVNKIDKETFAAKYLKPGRPLIIKGLAGNSPAGNKWTLQYLKDVCGDVSVDIFDNKREHTGSAYTGADLKMPFSSYIDLLSANQPTSLRVFLFNMFRRKPVLRKDFPCPPFFRSILGRVGYMFFGCAGTSVRIHQDIDMSNVLLTQFHGRKKVLLVDPRYSQLLYKLPMNTYSLVDLQKPDYARYPGMRYAEVWECLLEPGDALFMPSGFWHQVIYLDSGFSVSYRMPAVNPKMLLQGIVSLAIYMPVDKALNLMFGARWLSRKEKIAELRANEAIERLKENRMATRVVT